MCALGALFSAGIAAVTYFVAGDSLGGARVGASAVVGALAFYGVLSSPRRVSDSQRIGEARESPLVAASAAACLAVTGSRPRTVLLLRPRGPTLASAMKEAGRRILLGTRVDRALEASARTLASYSAVAVFRGLSTFTPEGIGQGEEEALGLAASSDLARETKLPMMMTACFFTPILLVLYAVFSHTYGATDLAELAAVEFIVLDLAFSLSASERSGP